MSEAAVKEHNVKYYVEKKSIWVQAAVIFMALSAAFRLIGLWGQWSDSSVLAMQIALPVLSNLLFIACILLLGKSAFWSTSVPVLMGVVFFIVKSFSFDSWLHTVLCIMLYLLVAVLYTVTAFGAIRSKWPLVPLFALPFLYHVLVEDLAALRDTANPVTLSAGMQEISVLCIMLALLFTAFAMKKKKPAQPEPELPKMKPPKVLAPEKKPAASAETAVKPAETAAPEKKPAPAETAAKPAAEPSQAEDGGTPPGDKA